VDSEEKDVNQHSYRQHEDNTIQNRRR